MTGLAWPADGKPGAGPGLSRKVVMEGLAGRPAVSGGNSGENIWSSRFPFVTVEVEGCVVVSAAAVTAML